MRDAASLDLDPVGRRLEALGLQSVREGPGSAAAAAQLFALPVGLAEYGLVLVGGDLDYPALLSDPQAMAGLVDHLEGGGGLYLSGAAWPLLLALAPDAVEVCPSTTDFGYVEASVSHEELLEQLDWSRVGVPLAAGLPVLDGMGEGVAWLTGEVQTAELGLVDGALMVEVEVGNGRVLYVTFNASEPRADEWWLGDPEPWELPDGSWDGRGAAIDRMLLRL